MYFVATAKPVKMPAVAEIAARAGFRQLDDARNETSTMHVNGKSVTPKSRITDVKERESEARRSDE